jgi:hypothetical protein
MKAIYELVTAAELKVGDVVFDLRFGTQEEYTVDLGMFEIIQGAPEYYPPRLRRLPATDDPRVLRRALENALNQMAVYGHTVSGEPTWIEQARQELESEGGEG